MIQFVQVSKKYPKTDQFALQEVSFEVGDGEFLFLIGPSGSGKTTVMRMMIREEKPTEGKIYFDDYDVTRLNRGKVYKLRRLIGVVFQDYKLIPHKNVYENVAFAMEVAGQSKHQIQDTVENLIDIVGLTHKLNSFPYQLSGGEQQRVAIARAIANNPRVLIADEPTGNLDPGSAWDIVQILTKINSWGTTVLMSTHGTDIVNSLNKRVIQLHQGKIVRDDNKGQYELTRLDFSDKMLKSSGEEEESGKSSVIKVNLRTDKIREKLKHRHPKDTATNSAPVDQKDKTDQDKEQVAKVKEKPLVVSPAEESRPFQFLNLSGRRVAKEKEKSGKSQSEEPAGLGLAHAHVEPVKLTDEQSAEIAAEAEEIPVGKLDLEADLIKRLEQAGYKHVSDIINAGPEQLATEKVIDPIEVLAVSQALGEFVELEIATTTEQKK